MTIKYFAHACFGLSFANGPVLVTDPYDESVTYPPCNAECDAALVSHDHFDHNHVQSLSGEFAVVKEPGTYEIGSAKITATPCFHDPEQGALRGRNVIFAIEGDGLKIVHLGDLGHMPDAGQLAAMADADLMLIPIGGHFTIDTPQAVELIAQAKPRTAVAMHFHNVYCQFPITDEKEFAALTGAVEMPGEIEVTPEANLPAAIVMKYE